MHSSKFINTIRVLTPEELKRFFQFLKSPFYNTNAHVVKLYLLVRPYHPVYNSLKLNKEKVFKKLFPDRSYDHKKWLNLLADSRRLVEQYLVILQLEKESLTTQQLLLNAYSERPDCYNFFSKQVAIRHAALDRLPYRDDTYFREKTDLYLQYYEHPVTKAESASKILLNTAISQYEIFKQITEIKFKCAQNEISNTFRGESAKNSNTHDELNQNIIYSLYTQLDRLQKIEVTNQDLQFIVNQYISFANQLRHNDKANILKILLNYCIRLVNQGKLEFIPTSLVLYKQGLEQGVLITHGKLSESTFQNIISTGLHCLEFDWTKQFMEKYEQFLDAEVRDDAISIGKGNWFFKKGEYTQALDILQHTFKDTLVILKAKSIIIRSWFELFLLDENYYEFLIYQIEAFEKYVRREIVIAERLSKGYLKFLFYAKKITNFNDNDQTLKKLNVEIQNEPNLMLKSWLLEKTNKRHIQK